ncbi:MAG: hypothetical protein M0R30_09510 [Methanoregula sp.]|jgi:hypothetical protein|uniref:hypothetical protein n=1 Tax=Methanoregula sp. TaxID=2052170 RepID=UPI0025FE344C|nr:hypothetical protein [Methanoregula sp.]MCK9631868.1 hypothetical protein [Methanoregula sp.]
MYSALFDPSMLFAVLLISGIFLIPALCIAALASVFYCLLEKIQTIWLRVVLPVAIAIVFMVGDRPFQSFIYTSLSANDLLLLGSFISIVHVIPTFSILAMGAITPFPLIREQITLKRPWYAVFAATTITFICTSMFNMFITLGPRMGTYTDISWIPYVDVVTQFIQFVSVIVIAAAVFGAILFLQHVRSLVAGHARKRWILFAVTGSLIVLLPSAGIGGVAIFFGTVTKKIPGRLVPIALSAAAMIVLVLAGTMLLGIPGMRMIINFSLITMVIMAFAVLVPFQYFGAEIPKDWQPVILLAGAVAADLILSLIATVFDLGERLTSDPLTILTFAEGGMIIAACTFVAGNYLVMRRDPRLSPADAGEAP